MPSTALPNARQLVRSTLASHQAWRNQELDKNYFINFDPMTGVSINTFRKPDGYVNDDVRGLVQDMRAERAGCCDLDGSRAALEDGSLWADEDQEAIEMLHNAIREFEAEQAIRQIHLNEDEKGERR